jgi:hypothetical protein
MHRSIVLAIAAATLIACQSKGTADADFCPTVAKTAKAQQTLAALLNSGEIPVPAEVETALDNFRELLGKMADAAPKELATNMLLVVNGFTAFDLGLQKVDYDYNRLFTDPEAAAAAEADMAAMDAPETQAAMDAVDEFAFTKCGVALDTSGE